jgi:hypothetical protein
MLVLGVIASLPRLSRAAEGRAPAGMLLELAYEDGHYLVIRGPNLPGREIRINYLEAYCRAGSTDADWDKHTVVPHRVKLLSISEDRRLLRLRDTLEDGVIVEHTVTASDGEVDFRLVARNPGTKRSEAHWAQPCVRLAAFMGFDPKGPDLDDYLPKGFIFLDGKLTRLSEVKPWAKTARYVPGQTWCPIGVPRTDVNPRPLSPLVPSNGLIGAFSADEKWIFATAWEPYQELFQGVIRCLHSDFRLGGLQPGETKNVRGKIYVVPNDVTALVARYTRDFPEHQPRRAAVPKAVTSLANPEVVYTVVSEKGHVLLRQGDVEAVVVDNRAVDDAVLSKHGAGYHGVAALRHVRQSRSLFVPSYAGLNFEHIHDGTDKPRDILFEPRKAPMELRRVSEHIAELYQRPTPFWGLESCQRYELRPDGVIEMTFECIPRRNTFTNGYMGLFWASYIDRPESLDIHFRGVAEGEAGPAIWQRGVTPAHGTLATHRSMADARTFPHEPKFPLELPFGFSRQRYVEPWYFGVCRGMAFVQVFRTEDQVWISQSPSGGGKECPAWDFQWYVPKPQVGMRYQLKMRAAYVALAQDENLEMSHRRVQDLVATLTWF